MVLTKTGRNLFPKLQYRINGLEPNRKYVAYLRFELVDNKKYKYKSGGWTATECCDPITPPGYVMHPDGSKCGEHWMKTGLPFDRVKITNNSDDPRDNVLLQSMRKYRPVVSIYYAVESLPYSNEMVKVAEFSSRLQDFIAVTAYQNTRITELKIKNNPYAKGFREGPKSRKRSMSSTGTTPSPEVKLVKGEYYMGQPGMYGGQLQQTSQQFTFQQSSPIYQQFYQYQPSAQMFPQLPGSSAQFCQPMSGCYYQTPWAFTPANGQIWFQAQAQQQHQQQQQQEQQQQQQILEVTMPKAVEKVEDADTTNEADVAGDRGGDGGGGGGYSCTLPNEVSGSCKQQIWISSAD